jgi:acetyl-CoA C-acetyltransferase
MSSFRKKIYISAGYTTTFFGPGRPDFDPSKSMPSFESYLTETAEGSLEQLVEQAIDEGIIGSFMSARFLKQANLPGFLPFMIPDLKGKPCTAVEGACGTGGRAIAMAARSVLSDISDVVFASAFEIQNTMKSVYGADVLAGAAYFGKERKKGAAYYFPGIFAERAGAYFRKYGEKYTRMGFAKWYEQAIEKARKNPKAQEHFNKTANLFDKAMTLPDPKSFLPYLNQYDCSKVSDGASSLMVFSEEGLKKCGLAKSEAVELVALGESESDITRPPKEPTVFGNTKNAVEKALKAAKLSIKDIDILEVHDCFTISGILALEAAGFALEGKGPEFVMDGNIGEDGAIPVNLSGGLVGFGHPTGASGVRQMVDLLHQLTGKAENPAKNKPSTGMMISMGGDDKTVTCAIVKKPASA